MAEDLRGFIELKGIRARRASLPERALRWCRRKPALAALVLVLALGGPAAECSSPGSTGCNAGNTSRPSESSRHWGCSTSCGTPRNSTRKGITVTRSATPTGPWRPIRTRCRRCSSVLGCSWSLESLDEAVNDLEGVLRKKTALGEAHYLLSMVYAGRDPEKAKAHRQVAEALLADTAEAYHLRSLGARAGRRRYSYLTSPSRKTRPTSPRSSARPSATTPSANMPTPSATPTLRSASARRTRASLGPPSPGSPKTGPAQ